MGAGERYLQGWSQGKMPKKKARRRGVIVPMPPDKEDPSGLLSANSSGAGTREKVKILFQMGRGGQKTKKRLEALPEGGTL